MGIIRVSDNMAASIAISMEQLEGLPLNENQRLLIKSELMIAWANGYECKHNEFTKELQVTIAALNN